MYELQHRGIMILITSRVSVGMSLGLGIHLRICALPPEKNQQLLTALAGNAAGLSSNIAAQLVNICGNNALAITILAGLLQGMYCTPQVSAAVCVENFPCVLTKAPLLYTTFLHSVLPKATIDSA